MQYQVPQFIETEDRIIGPLTVRQFILLVVAGLVGFVLYFFLATFLWIIAMLLLLGIASAFAFIKVNGRPLTSVIGSMFGYFWNPRLYVWKRKEELEAFREREAKKGESAIQNLWLRIIAGKEAIPKRERGLPGSPFEGAEEKMEILRKTTGEREAARRVDYR